MVICALLHLLYTRDRCHWRLKLEVEPFLVVVIGGYWYEDFIGVGGWDRGHDGSQ